jgi:hypothetical protein
LLYQKKTPKQKVQKYPQNHNFFSFPPHLTYPFCLLILANTLAPIFSSTSTNVSQTSPYFIMIPTSLLFVLKIPKKHTKKEKRTLNYKDLQHD